jgi:hypothetical protein
MYIWDPDGKPAATRPPPDYIVSALTSSPVPCPPWPQSELEAPLRWVSYECTMCGKEHSRWAVANPTIMQVAQSKLVCDVHVRLKKAWLHIKTHSST